MQCKHSAKTNRVVHTYKTLYRYTQDITETSYLTLNIIEIRLNLKIQDSKQVCKHDY